MKPNELTSDRRVLSLCGLFSLQDYTMLIKLLSFLPYSWLTGIVNVLQNATMLKTGHPCQFAVAVRSDISEDEREGLLRNVTAAATYRGPV